MICQGDMRAFSRTVAAAIMQAVQHDSAMSSTLHSVAAVPAALSAFLKGSERRAAVFAELQCGHADAADDAVAAALRAFRNHAASLPMADWPQRFWMLLVATPAMRQAAPGANWREPLGVLADLHPSDRQALLLRLAAGLEEAAAAAVMGLDLPGYRAALASACPRDGDGRPDVTAWRSMAEAIQNTLRHLPPDRVARLARLREAAIEGAVPPRAASAAHEAVARPSAGPPRDWRRRMLAFLAVMVALALAATWFWPVAGEDKSAGPMWQEPEILVEALPRSEPAARFSAANALRSHPDRALILDAEEASLASQADFLAWYSASIESSPGGLVEPVGDLPLDPPPAAAGAPR